MTNSFQVPVGPLNYKEPYWKATKQSCSVDAIPEAATNLITTSKFSNFSTISKQVFFAIIKT